MDAGGDWSGKPDRDDLLIFAVAAMENAEDWSEHCTIIRQQIGKPRDVEFHARDMSDAERFALLSAARNAGLVVGVLVLKKSEAPDENFAALFNYTTSAQELLGAFFSRYQLKRFWYDSEVNGRKAQQEFETGLYRFHRAIYPNTTLKASCRPSHTSDLVQLADCVAYAFRRQALNAIKYAPLRQLVKEIAADQRNLVIRL